MVRFTRRAGSHGRDDRVGIPKIDHYPAVKAKASAMTSTTSSAADEDLPCAGLGQEVAHLFTEPLEPGLVRCGRCVVRLHPAQLGERSLHLDHLLPIFHAHLAPGFAALFFGDRSMRCDLLGRAVFPLGLFDKARGFAAAHGAGPECGFDPGPVDRLLGPGRKGTEGEAGNSVFGFAGVPGSGRAAGAISASSAAAASAAEAKRSSGRSASRRSTIATRPAGRLGRTSVIAT